MQRHEIAEIMRELKLQGMRQAYDDTLQAATQHKWRPQKLVGELLRAELAEKTARSIRYQMAAAKFPIMKTLDGFDFSASPINEELIRSLHDGTFMEDARNAVLVGGTGTGKTHLVTAIGATAVNARKRVRFFSAVDLVNKLEAEPGESTERYCLMSSSI